MHRLLVLGLILTTPSLALAQDPPAATDDDDKLKKWADDLDRPLARALAFERRDVVKEILESPSSIKAATAAELAKEVSIPLKHAELITKAVKGGASPTATAELVKAALPKNFTPPASLKLMSASHAQLVAAGLSEGRAWQVLRFRTSVKRANLHFREVRAINEARARGRDLVRETATNKQPWSVRAKAIARSLGLKVESINPTATELRADRANRRARVVSSATAAEAKGPALAEFRNMDGTLDWKKFSKSEVARGAGGVAHFAFALFLKELAMVLKTGKQERLQEFLQGLTSTDFYVNYGLFAAGARAADVAYGRYVRRLSRKTFMSGVLRSNLVLAAGLAVPMVVRGRFKLDTFLVDVAALGISATAVKGAVEAGKGVYRLIRGGKAAINLGKLAGPVGWVLSAGETAIVLLAGDYLAKKFDKYMTHKKLKKQLDAAEKKLNEVLDKVDRGERLLPEEITSAIEGVEVAYDDMRRVKVLPLEARLGEFRSELNKASVRSLRADHGFKALKARLEENPALERHYANRYGSIDKFVAALRKASDNKIEGALEKEADEFEAEFRRLLPEAYEGTPDADPAPAPGSRLALYDEETTLLLKALDGTTDPEARRHIALAIERVRLSRAIDRSVLGSGEVKPKPKPNANRGVANSIPGQ